MAYRCVKGYNKDCDGCMDCNPDQEYYCPICGEEVLEAVYVSNNGEVLGCDNCAHIKDPWEMLAND